MEKTIKYTNEEITVLWKPDLCVHSGKCVKGLPGVFKPNDKPWVQLEHAKTDALMATIKTCPSGALSYESKADEKETVQQELNSENIRVETVKNGPIRVFGNLTVTCDDGSVIEKQRVASFCRCGKTKNTPFCDGSHKGEMV